jgi:hypothetical protein
VNPHLAGQYRLSECLQIIFKLNPQLSSPLLE